jgi:hypothetical protein
MVSAFRTIYRYYIALYLVAVILAFFLAGLGAFGVASEVEDGATVDEEFVTDEFSAHGGIGFFLGPGALLLVLIALGARLGRNRVLLSLAVLGLWFLQELLAGFGYEAPAVGALHPVNGIAILALVAYLAHGAWRRWTDLGQPAGTPRSEQV